jgi:hypothetical protein
MKMSSRRSEDSLATLSLLVLIPLFVVFVLAVIAMGLIGGKQLLGFAFHQLFTLHGLAVSFGTVVGLVLITVVRHAMWYDDEPPPMWFRGSIWTNIFEFIVLAAIVAIGVWAIPHFGAVVK